MKCSLNVPPPPPRTIGDISPSSVQQSANIPRDTPRFKMSQTLRRYIADTSAMFLTCSRKHRRYIFDVIVHVTDSLGDPSPILSRRRYYGDAFACAFYLFSSSSIFANRTKVISSLCSPQCTIPSP